MPEMKFDSNYIKNKQDQAKLFLDHFLVECCWELLERGKTGILKHDGRVRELAKLHDWVDAPSRIPLAEKLIYKMAAKFVCNQEFLSSVFNGKDGGKHLIDLLSACKHLVSIQDEYDKGMDYWDGEKFSKMHSDWVSATVSIIKKTKKIKRENIVI